MSQERVVVLGAAGYLGRPLVSALAARGYDVRAFDRLKPTDAGDKGEWISGDFFNETHLCEALRERDVVYHLIATRLPAPSNEDPLADAAENIVGSLRLLNLCVAEGVKRIVFVSSGGGIYGNIQAEYLSEDLNVRPVCAYGISKLAVEKYLALYHHLHGMQYCALRVGNPYGGEQRLDRPQGLVTQSLAKALRDEAVEIWGDGSVVRDFLHIDDVVEALLRAMHYAGEARVMNVASGIGRSVNEVLDAVDAVLGRKLRRKYLPGRPADARRVVLDCSLAERELHWRAGVEFEDGLRRSAEEMRARISG